MAKGKKVVAEKIILDGVRVLNSKYTVLDPHEEHEELTHFTIGLKSETGFNLEEKQIQFILFVKITGVDKDQKEVGIEGEYCFEFRYTIENLDDFVEFDENGESFHVDEMLGATIAGITYSTCRGIILNRTQATEFNGVLLPVINPARLLEEDSFEV